MENAFLRWKFDPRFGPGQTVWFVDERIKKGNIRGLGFENSSFDGHPQRVQTVYFVEVVHDLKSIVYEIPEGRLFDNEQQLIEYLTNNKP